jgi:oxygen-dependent protoporphyrinogen oxidase
VSSKWAHRAPEGSVLLRAFLGGALDPDAVDLGDDALVQIAVQDLARVLGVIGKPTLTRVHRWRNAGAQHDVGHASRVAQIEARLANLPGLFVAGSGFRAIGLPDCIADGRAAGETAARYAKRLS